MNFKFFLSFAFISCLIFGVSASSVEFYEEESVRLLAGDFEKTITTSLDTLVSDIIKRGSKPAVTSEFLEKRKQYADIIKSNCEQIKNILDQINDASVSQIDDFVFKLINMKSPLNISIGIVDAIKQTRPKVDDFSDVSFYRPFVRMSIKTTLTFCQNLHQEVEAGKVDELVYNYYNNQTKLKKSSEKSNEWALITIIVGTFLFIGIVAVVISFRKKSNQMAPSASINPSFGYDGKTQTYDGKNQAYGNQNQFFDTKNQAYVNPMQAYGYGVNPQVNGHGNTAVSPQASVNEKV